MLKNLIRILASLPVLFLSINVYAEDAKYQSTYESPRVFNKFFKGGVDLDGFTKNILRFFKSGRDGAKDTFSKQDLDELRKTLLDQATYRQLTGLVRFDKNLDAKLSVNEMVLSMGSNYRGQSSRSEEGLKRHSMLDLDKDGSISYQEMATLTRESIASVERNDSYFLAREYLWLDPNKDNIITLDELKFLAGKAFRTSDINNDGLISLAEYNKVKEYKNSHASSTCSFGNIEFPKDLVVYASLVGKGQVYKGGTVFKNRRVQTITKVSVNKDDRPVALILAGGEPMIWEIDVSDNTDIYAVVLISRYEQEIIGLNKKTIVLNSKSRKGQGCGYVSFSDQNLVQLNPLSRRLFGKSSDMYFVPERLGEVTINSKIIEGTVKANKKYKPSPVTNIEASPSYYTPRRILPREVEILKAVSEGYIRTAMDQDTEIWLDLLERKERVSPTIDVPLIAGVTLRETLPKIYSGNAYVVLKDTSCTEMNLNAQSLSFIVPKGINPPENCSPGTDIYDLNTLSCTGARFGRHPHCRTRGY
ncbi:MAG: hypothetical protein COA45_10255 [Zetaproteobacteria bacterium]|nr:MAG: hypothetical protein COA45_10255 [Zetaproteobacteria bacterium]